MGNNCLSEFFYKKKKLDNPEFLKEKWRESSDSEEKKRVCEGEQLIIGNYQKRTV